jgi:metal-responsive CopG/Arc/MetJ family transcriptional regulator
MAQTSKSEKVVFGINIDKELKKKLKKYCVEHDITLTEAIETAIKEYLEKRGVK